MSLFPLSLVTQQPLPGPVHTDTTMEFLQGVTTAPLVVWKDAAFTEAHPTVIKPDAFGRWPVIFVKPDGTSATVKITYSNGRSRTITGFYTGALPSSASTSVAEPTLPVVRKTGGAVVLAAADFGKVIDVPASGADVIVTMPQATTVPDGRLIAIRNAGGGKAAILRTITPDLIDDVPTLALTRSGQSIVLVSTGAGFEVLTRTAGPDRTFAVENRTLLVPPTVAVTGAHYLAAPTAAGGGWAPNFIYTANGSGGWSETVPEIGMAVLVKNETDVVGTVSIPREMVWSGVEWIARQALISALATSLGSTIAAGVADAGTGKILVVTEQYASGVSPPAAAQNAWTDLPLNLVTRNTISGATAVTPNVTLPIGTYLVRAAHTFVGAGKCVIRFKSDDTSKVLMGSPLNLAPAASYATTPAVAVPAQSGSSILEGVLTLTAPESFSLQYHLTGVPHAFALGEPTGIVEALETYGTLTIQKVA